MTGQETLAEIVRKALLAGQSVEIDGLGIFQASPEGYEFLPQLRPEVFVAYVAEDLAPARRLCEALRAAGSSPWLDKDKLLPGQNWPRAIGDSDCRIAFAFVGPALWRPARRIRSCGAVGQEARLRNGDGRESEISVARRGRAGRRRVPGA